MKKISLAVALIGAALLSGCGEHDSEKAEPAAAQPSAAVVAHTNRYPAAKTVATVDDYHGTKVADPYRWMEHEDDPDLKRWIEQERRYGEAFLAKLPGRKLIGERLTQLWNYPTQSVPVARGSKWFVYQNTGLQNQRVLFAKSSLHDEGWVILDPNTFSADGTVALNTVSISREGHYIAYATSKSGSDWQQWSIREVKTGRDLANKLNWSKFSGAAWTRDEEGFFYSRYDAPKQGQARDGVNYNQKLYYHALETPQREDRLIYARPDHKDWGFASQVSEDGNYLIITVWKGTDSRNRLFYKNLRDENSKVVELISTLDARYTFVGNRGSRFILQTNLDAPLGKVIAVDIRHPARAHWKTLVPEQAQALQSVVIVNNRLSLRYLDAALTRIQLNKLDGTPLVQIKLPGKGSASNLIGQENSDTAFISYSSYTQPSRIYQVDFETGKLKPYWAPSVKFNPQDYVSEQVFYKSKDGTKIPMIISHKKGLKKDGKTPTLLYGYGGFNIAITPRFSVMDLAWMEQGGIYAVANLRGGSEYGEAWHKAGSLHNKQNVFDDFIAAAKWLIANQYTSREHLGIYGRSNGGLLIGAVMTQRPDLFAAALPAVGVMDMLRFQKFTIGWAWTSDYGSSDNAADFKVLYRYSPYHNIKKGTQYPPTMVMTADHDDRVVPAHSFKFGARLQAAQSGLNPIIMRIEHKAGHGAGKPTSKRIAEARDIITFLARYTGLKLQRVKNILLQPEKTRIGT